MTFNTKSIEWEKIIGKLSDVDFEHLCYELVKSMSGFVNVDLRAGSYDGGRDIEATFKTRDPAGITELTEQWRFECKKYSKGVPFDDISGKIMQANLNKIDKLVIMSNMHLTTPCKDEIKNIQHNQYCEIIDWTGLRFQDILFQYPDICKDFFPDEKLPQRFRDATSSQELISATQRASSNFGVESNFKFEINPQSLLDIDITTDMIKERLSKTNIDLNIKSLLCQQLSGLFLSIKRKEDALFFINESLEITPNNIPVLLNKAYILRKLDKFDECDRCYDNILEIDKNNKFALNNKANLLTIKGNFEEALVLVEKSLNTDPNFTRAIANKVAILKDMNRIEDANDFLEPNLITHRDSKTLLGAKVQLLIESKDLKEAMKINNQILELDPKDVVAINRKGILYGMNSNWQKPEKYLPLATECFEKVITLDDEDTIGLSNKVKSLAYNGSLEDAETMIDNALNEFPTDPYLLGEKAEILLEKGKVKKALKYLNKSLKRRYSRQKLLSKGHALLMNRKHKETAKLADSILKYDKKNSGAWYLKGLALEKLHQGKRAKICFKRAKEYKKVPISLLE